MTQAAREVEQFEPLSILTDILQLLPWHARDVTLSACNFAAEVILSTPHAFQSTVPPPRTLGLVLGVVYGCLPSAAMEKDF